MSSQQASDPWKAQRNYAIALTDAGDVATGEALRSVLADADALLAVLPSLVAGCRMGNMYAIADIGEYDYRIKAALEKYAALPEHLRQE